MKPERWQQIERIYQSALELAPADRSRYVREACAQDGELQQEVERLLALQSKADDFMESPAIEEAARRLAEAQSGDPAHTLTGQTLSHYRIMEKIGEGGMGVVYRARDERLKRDVAIKVLPPELMMNPERKRRFVQEARAASALNHPNIVTIHEIASEGGYDFIVMEHVAGKTLNHRIGRKGMKISDLLKHAIQIADALTVAHAAGIVHRDLKPANIAVTEEGRAKVLDFGLAKLAQSDPVEAATLTSSMVPRTEEGRILGTAAYMSPEQAEGKTVDARSDIFSFGAVLYEMATGSRAFAGDSSMATISAILNREPSPMGEGVPQEFEKIVQRCLRKDPARRFQHIADVKIALEDLKEESDSGSRAVAAAPGSAKRRAWWIWVTIAALAAMAAVAGYYYLQQAGKPEAPLRAIPLAAYGGLQGWPSLSPDGREVAFVWHKEKQDNSDIYVQMISGGPPQQLTSSPAFDSYPKWSPDGNRIAFLRVPGVLYLISPRGGPERRLTNITNPSYAWTSDGKSIGISDRKSPDEAAAIWLISAETGEKIRKLTTPPAGVVGDLSCAFSPDGKYLAFKRTKTFGVSRGDVYIQPLDNGAPQGEAWPLTSDLRASDPLGWMPDSREVLYVSDRDGPTGLWRVRASRGAESRRIAGTDEAIDFGLSLNPPVRLAFQSYYAGDPDIYRMDIPPAPTVASPAVKIAASSQYDGDPKFSPDGTRIVFVSNRSGFYELYLCDADGANPVQLTSFGNVRHAGAPAWSHDGKQIAFDSDSGGNVDIFAIHTDTRATRQLTTEPSTELRPTWSLDNQWIYFGSNRSGAYQIWKAPAAGGAAQQVTREGGAEANEGPDGYVYYTKRLGGKGIWRLPLDGGKEKLAIPAGCFGWWGVADKGIYFVNFDGPASTPRPLMLYDFEKRQVSQIAAMEKLGRTATSAFSVSGDGRTVAWMYRDPNSRRSTLWLIDNFH